MTYRAFISYRRQDASAAARWLREKLLGFRPPKELLDKVTPQQRADLERPAAYFLDTAFQVANDDFWTKNIEPALRESEYLIVISSPAALLARPDSSDNWVAREIDAFQKMRGEEEGRRRTIVVLAAGAPEDRFPGRPKALGDNVDWADLRAVSRFAWLRAGAAERLGDALLKIVARLYEVPQELLPILRQEEARKRGRLRLAIGATAAVVAVVLGGALGWGMIERSTSIERQNEKLRSQARFIAETVRGQFDQGYWSTALSLALESLPRDGAVSDRSYIVQAEALLQEIVRQPIRERYVPDMRVNRFSPAVFAPDASRVLLLLENGGAALWRPDRDASPTMLVGHTDRVSGGAFSRDGTKLLTTSADGTVRIWSTEPGQAPDVLRGDGCAIYSAVFSPDATRVLGTCTDGTARLWTVKGQRLAVLRDPNGKLGGAVFSANGQRIMTRSASADRTITGAKERVRLWDGNGQLIRELQAQPFSLVAWSLSPDGQRVVGITPDGRTRLWDGRGVEIATFEGLSASGLLFSPDSAQIVTTSGDGIVQLWSAQDGRELNALASGRMLQFYGLSFTDNGGLVLAIAADNTVRIWDTQYGIEWGGRGLRGHTGIILHAQFLPDRKRVITASYDGSIRLWDIYTGAQLAILRLAGGEIESVRFSDDGTRIAAALKDGTLRLVENSEVSRLTVLSGHREQVYSVALSPDRTQILTASRDHTGRLWRAADGTPGPILSDHGGDVLSAVFSPDGTRVLTGSSDQTARLWRLGSSERPVVLAGHNGIVHHTAFSPNGARMLTLAANGTGYLWDAATAARLATLGDDKFRAYDAVFLADSARVLVVSLDSENQLWIAAHPEQRRRLHDGREKPSAATLSPRGERVAAGWSDGTIRVWTTDRGKALPVLHDRGGAILGLALSPDGRRLVSLAADGTSRLWDVDGGREVAVLAGDVTPIDDVEFSANGMYMLTKAFNRNVVRLRNRDGEILASLSGHDEPVISAAFSSDGTRILTGSNRGLAIVWRAFADVQSLIDHACSLLPRPLDRAQRRTFFLDEDSKDPPCGWHPDMKDKPRR